MVIGERPMSFIGHLDLLVKILHCTKLMVFFEVCLPSEGYNSAVFSLPSLKFDCRKRFSC